MHYYKFKTSSKNQTILICILLFILSFLTVLLCDHFIQQRPVISDELSYQFQGQTFSLGRLTNPSPPSPEHFESQGILVEPTFSSKYPPLYGLALASSSLVGHDSRLIARTALALSCITLFLLGNYFFSQKISLILSLIVATNSFYIFEMANSYRNSSLTLLASLLVMIGLVDISQNQLKNVSIMSAFAIGLGLSMLALSRPIMGAICYIIPVVLILTGLVKVKQWKTITATVSLPIMAIIFQFFLNYKVTENPIVHPHTQVSEQYFINPTFNFLEKNKLVNYSNEYLERYYREWENKIYLDQRTLRGYLDNLFQKKLHKYIQFHFSYFLIPFLILGLLVVFYKRRDRIEYHYIIMSLVSFSLLFLFIIGHLYLYSLVVVPHLFIFTGIGISFFLKQSKGFLHNYSVFFVYILCGLAIYQLNHNGVKFAASRTNRSVYFKPEYEDSIANKLSGKKVIIFVRFGNEHSIFDNWIYSTPNLTESNFIWVNDLGKDKNKKLALAFPQRETLCVFIDNSMPLIRAEKTCL